MTRAPELESLRAEVRYRRERVALMRAKVYRGVGSGARLLKLERELEQAEWRLREERRRSTPRA